MSVTAAVKFRHTINQFSTKETLQFVNQLALSHIEIIKTALFAHILNPSHTQQIATENINHTISNIIALRKPKPLPKYQINHYKLSQIPKALIGYVSSFLPQTDYAHFSQCNRFIYLSCNEPNLLQKLDLLKLKNYAHINFKLYRSVKALELYLHSFQTAQFHTEQSLLQNIPIMPKLQSIHFNAKWSKHCKDIASVLHSINDLNTRHITSLKLSHLLFFINKAKAPMLLSVLMSKFANIDCLCLENVFVSLEIDKLKYIFYGLKELKLYGTDQTIKLLKAFENNLECLTMENYRFCDSLQLRQICFRKLKKFTLAHSNLKLLSDITFCAPVLKEICINYDRHNLCAQLTLEMTYKQQMFTEMMSAVMTEMIINCKCLEKVTLKVIPSILAAVMLLLRL